MKKRILVIEDESSIADNIRYGLESEGFEVLWSSTGGEGRRALSGGSFSLIILDVGLPDISGFDLCREIRKTSAIPIIFLTARSEEIDRVVGLEIGADDYIVKPFSIRELMARVKAILRRGEPVSQAKKPAKSAAIGPFSVDEMKCRISYHDSPLDLSRYEYRLLKALIERPGRVLSRDQLMDLAWDSPESSLDRTVDAHIKSLRAKMKKVDAEEEPILTHRGMGYSFKDDW